jgi:hypothetical protein
VSPGPPGPDPGPAGRQDPDDDPAPRQGPPGGMRPLGPAAPAIAGAIGLIAGWAVRPVWLALDRTPPLVPWTAALVLATVAAVLGAAALATRRTLGGPERLEPHRGVNRLVMARACVVAGALVAGAYAGYALAWSGLGTDLAEQRLVRSAVAALAAVAVLVTALLLERACRTRSEQEDA